MKRVKFANEFTETDARKWLEENDLEWVARSHSTDGPLLTIRNNNAPAGSEVIASVESGYLDNSVWVLAVRHAAKELGEDLPFIENESFATVEKCLNTIAEHSAELSFIGKHSIQTATERIPLFLITKDHKIYRVGRSGESYTFEDLLLCARISCGLPIIDPDGRVHHGAG